MRNQASNIEGPAPAQAGSAKQSAPSADGRPAAGHAASPPDWTLAFGDTLPVIAGRGEARSWPRVIP